MKNNLRIKILFIIIILVSCNTKSPERFVDFGDYKIHIKESGQGQPTIIIEAGLGDGLDPYDTLQSALSSVTKVFTYDRPGLGKSSKSPNPRTLPVYINELKRLLDKEKIKPPYIFVGHSLGGLIARYFAYKYPDEVVGLVLIDCLHEDWIDFIRSTHSKEEVKKFNNALNPENYSGVTKEEWEQFENNCDIIRGKEIPANIATRIITSVKFMEFHTAIGYCPEDMNKWAEFQGKVIKNVKDGKQIITNKSDHSVQNTEPELIINSAIELIEIYRNNTE